MASHSLAVAPQKPLEDPLAYLPRSIVMEYRKGEIIYSNHQPCNNLYLVISGTVKITRVSDHGSQVVVDLYRPDEFFGEAAFVSLSHTSEQAVAHQKTTLMAWRAGDIEEMVMKRPQLAMALLQAFGQRALGFTERIESLSVDSIDQRLARALVRFSERLGTPQTDGSVHMEPLTHELLAQYVGTSRELVTCRMTNFRRQGYLQYSRKGITLYRDALRAWLRDSN
jgi:CRP/FNR family transcriptional regulator, cyclic AMP receptor protein